MSRYRVKNGRLSAQDEGVDSVGNTNMASSVTPTLAVHHRCITATAFCGVSRIRRPKRSRMVKPKTAAQDTPGRRIRLRFWRNGPTKSRTRKSGRVSGE
jgi:hypothetical protein